MTKIRENAIGDLLGAFKQLRPTDDASRAAIAELLGLGWRAAKQTATPINKPSVPPGKDSKKTRTTGGASKSPKPPRHMPDFSEPGRHPPVLSPKPSEEQDEEAPPEPTWLVAVKPLPHTAEEKNRPEPRPLEPLLEPIQTRALLTDVLASEVADGPVDVRALEDRICRVEPITELPLLKRRSLGLGIEVLVDRAEALTPFFADQVALLRRIRYLVGTENIRVVRFVRNPFLGAGVRGRHTWKPWRPPVPARPILVLTDLGILDVTELDVEQPAVETDWGLFARRAQEAECSVLALVPYPRSRWPDGLADLLPILPWNRQLSLKDLRQVLGRRWAVTG